MAGKKNIPVAIDPAALILKGKALEIYYLKKFPHVPFTASVAKEIFKEISAADKKATVAAAKNMADVCRAIIEA
jgi:hypothetical protein